MTRPCGARTNFSIMQHDLPKQNLTLSIAERFCENNPGLIFCEEASQFYNYRHGVYLRISERDVRNTLRKNYPSTIELTYVKLNEVVKWIADIRKYSLDDFNKQHVINLENGLFDFDTFSLKKHDISILSTIRVPYRYEEGAKNDLWIKTLNDIFEYDQNKIKIIQEFFGYCLTRDIKMQKALILTGEGANGKSTITNALKEMIGQENCSFLSLRYFNNAQKASVIKDKLVNICEEIPKKVEDYEAEFKTIVVGGELQVSPKYIPDYVIKPYCKLIFAVNEFPYIDDKTSAFYRRLLMLRLDKEFKEEEQNKHLGEQLLEERSGILNWAIDGLRRLNKRKTFLIDEYMKKDIQAIKELNNPVIQWATENLIELKESNAYVIKQNIYDMYSQWCSQNGHRPTGSAKFGAEIYRIFRHITERDRRLAFGARDRIWPYIVLKDNYTPSEPIQVEE